tara:strand:+ start:716 stop:943 length:228 start_codon:yes stop_codon:yes gene_type:complete
MLKPLTKRQLEYLQALQHYHSQHGIMPSQKELAEYVGNSEKSDGAANRILRELETKGYIERIPGAERGIVLTQSS